MHRLRLSLSAPDSRRIWAKDPLRYPAFILCYTSLYERLPAAIVLLVTIALLSACGGGAPTRAPLPTISNPGQSQLPSRPTPTPEPTVTPTPDLQATASAGIAATIEALRRRIPSPTPIPPTATPRPTATPVIVTPTPTPIPTLVAMVDRVRPSVVWVGVIGPDFIAAGSGVIFEVDDSTKTALVMTNHHVIVGSRQILVLDNEATPYSAVIVGANPLRDLAILRICCSTSFRALPFGNASNLSSGTEVIAIGYPLSIGSDVLAPGGPPTVTRGIVSAIRDISTTIDDEPFEGHVIQTDAPINPGNSGGPLLTASGEIVEINTFGITLAESLGFAVSEKTISATLPDLLAGSQIWTQDTPLGILSTTYVSQAHWFTVQVPRGWTIDYTDDFTAEGKEISRVVMWHPELSTLYSMVVQISFEEIDTTLYQSLTSYLPTNPPVAPPGAKEFAVVSGGPIGDGLIRTNRPVPANRFNLRYGPEDDLIRVVEDWYLLGRYVARVSATAASDAWFNDENVAVRKQLELVLDSFQPSAFTSDDNPFSVAHPPSWQVIPGDLAEYWAEDLAAEQRVLVQIRSAEGHTNVSNYADAVQGTILTGETFRQLVLTGRSNPSYRIEYASLSPFLDVGKQVRGAALITLAGTNAIWVFVEGPPEDWEATKALADDILLRFAVRP